MVQFTLEGEARHITASQVLCSPVEVHLHPLLGNATKVYKESIKWDMTAQIQMLLDRGWVTHCRHGQIHMEEPHPNKVLISVYFPLQLAVFGDVFAGQLDWIGGRL